MKTVQMRAFDAVARCGGIRAAARQLGVTQPALTKSIKELEKSLGVQLLYRGSRGVELTAAGQRVLVRARAALREIEQAEAEMQAYANRSIGQVSLSISPMLGEIIFPSAFQAFRKQLPEVSVKLVEAYATSVSGMIAEGEIDFALVLLPNREQAANLKTEHWLNVGHKIVARKSHPLNGPVDLQDLLQQEWLITNRAAGGQFAILSQLCAKHGFDLPRSITEIPSLSLLRATLRETDAISIAPVLPNTPGAENFKSLECLALPDLTRGFGVVSSANSGLSTSAKVMKDLLQRACMRLREK